MANTAKTQSRSNAKSKAAPRVAPEKKQSEQVQAFHGSESNYTAFPIPIEGTMLEREGVKEKIGKGNIPNDLITFTENGIAVKEERKSEDRRKGDRRSRKLEAGTMQSAGLAEQQGDDQQDDQDDDQDEQGNEGGQQEGKKVDPDALRESLKSLGTYSDDVIESMVKAAIGGNNQPRSGRPQQNNVTRPGSDTKTGRVWATCDQIRQQENRIPSFDDVAKILKRRDPDFADATIRTQIARWRAFNGITGRQDSGDRGGKKKDRGNQQSDRMDDDEFEVLMGLLTNGKLDNKPELKARVENEEQRRRNAVGVQSSPKS